MAKTIRTVAGLERHEASGMFYNWYSPATGEKLRTFPTDGSTIKPFLSSVDNGWLATALLLVSRGEAPLGVVYSTDAAADPNVRIVGTFPADSHRPIIYPAAVMKAATAIAVAVCGRDGKDRLPIAPADSQYLPGGRPPVPPDIVPGGTTVARPLVPADSAGVSRVLVSTVSRTQASVVPVSATTKVSTGGPPIAAQPCVGRPAWLRRSACCGAPAALSCAIRAFSAAPIRTGTRI